MQPTSQRAKTFICSLFLLHHRNLHTLASILKSYFSVSKSASAVLHPWATATPPCMKLHSFAFAIKINTQTICLLSSALSGRYRFTQRERTAKNKKKHNHPQVKYCKWSWLPERWYHFRHAKTIPQEKRTRHKATGVQRTYATAQSIASALPCYKRSHA